MGEELFEIFSKLDHIFVENLYRAEETATEGPNSSELSNPYVFDRIGPYTIWTPHFA